MKSLFGFLIACGALAAARSLYLNDGFDAQIFILIAVMSFFIGCKVYDTAFFNRKPRADAVFVFLFFTALCVPAAHINKDRVSLKENRVLTAYRPLVKDGKLNVTYGKDFDSWFNDRFFMRKQLILMYRHVTALNFHRESNRAFVGRDKWLFYKGADSILNFKNVVPLPEESMEEIAAYLTELDDWCRARGKSFYFIIAPDKHRVYGEFYPPHIQKTNPDTQSQAARLIEYLKTHTRVKTVYPLSALLAKKQQSDDLLYWKNDTHWNELGAYVAYGEIMKALLKDRPSLTVFKTSFDVPYASPNMDLMKMISVDEKDYADVFYKKSRLNNAEKCAAVTSKGSDGEDTICKNPKGKKRLYFQRDSFGVGLIPYFTETFAQTDVHWGKRFSAADFKRAENSDVVVFETVERLLLSLLKDEKPSKE